MRHLRTAAGYYWSFSFTYFGKAYRSLAAKERSRARLRKRNMQGPQRIAAGPFLYGYFLQTENLYFPAGGGEIYEK
jgi:hypothetical protein